MENKIPKFKRKSGKDPLADKVDELLSCSNQDSFYYLISQILRGGNGKVYCNRQGLVPDGGSYQELEVNGPRDARRIIVDTHSFGVFATRDHYETVQYAGSPRFSTSSEH